ncbi:hypothetical protein LBMAG56_36260 [Verrucomicrobiota bacterium]|nr:hypothetical protein LBMAG56_36260 [Verrucomicrobiota bacterium]
MLGIAPTGKDTDNAALVFSRSASDGERGGVRCSAFDTEMFRANCGLKSQEYSVPVLGLISVRFAAPAVPSFRRIQKAATGRAS